ncbi:MAG: hypothetical protein H6728_17835 [Myxococcales bacterium]|nr:hypothetical protein [Myxococcales bacterium]
MVQTTFTKQKRERAKAMAWLQKIRAMEIRERTCSPDGELLTEERSSYVDYRPEEIASEVLVIMEEVVRQHGARQQANSHNAGRFSWFGVEADLTVPQLRALREAHVAFAEMVRSLPRRNPRLIPNGVVDGLPAFFHRVVEHKERKVRYVPYEEDNSTRVRTYEEAFQETTHTTQRIEIDYGMDARLLQKLGDMVNELGTAIQIAIDEANTKGHREDPLLESVVVGICEALKKVYHPTEAK